MTDVRVITAKDFALQCHKNRSYEDRPYSEHLRSVIEVLADFGYKDQWAEAGWLHHVLSEETSATREQLVHLFGPWVRLMVECCTGIGVNEKSRNAHIYNKVAMHPEAAIILVADRIATVEHIRPKSKTFETYVHNRAEFDQQVTSKAPFRMKERLDKAFGLKLSVRWM